jgi:protein-L-isoaspartate(D-aspartate) O-methyltransferase
MVIGGLRARFNAGRRVRRPRLSACAKTSPYAIVGAALAGYSPRQPRIYAPPDVVNEAPALRSIMPMDYARARANMVSNQLRPNRIEDPAVLAAMAEVPRERFLPKALRGVAYADEDLPVADGWWLIEPLVLARLIQAAEVQDSDVVLVVGCPTGYAGAVLARLAATVILLIPPAATAAVETLLDDLGVDNVVVTASDDPAAGHPSQAPFDVIAVIGSVPEVPPALLEQIGEGGRIVVVVSDSRVGKITVLTRLHGVIGRRTVGDAQTPPCPGLDSNPGFTF